MEQVSGSYIVRTLGCKANLYDSQLLETELQRRGWKPWSSTPDGLTPDLCVVNSCTVTDEADRQSRKMASRLSRDNPRAAVVMTGCAAEVDPERLTASKGIHYVIGNRSKPQLVDLILERLQSERPPSGDGEILGASGGYAEMLSRHPIDREWAVGSNLEALPMTEGYSDKTRAFLKIQEGCNSFCTYCVIPYGRGPSRSLRPGEIAERVRALVAQGTQEVIITGTNIGDYGTDWRAEGDATEDGLTVLIELLLRETDIPRIRVSSLDPTEITPRMMALMEREPRFCPHFHVSLQSPHSRILRLMKRKYGFEEVKSCLEAIARIRGPSGGVFVGMDVITGFPGETREEFEWGRDRLIELPWMRLHVFPYSERAGTPATRLPGVVAKEERIRRARGLQKLSLQRLQSVYARVLADCEQSGAALEGILVEKSGSKGTSGLTPNYLRIAFEGQPARNSLVSARPRSIETDEVAGEVFFRTH